MRASVAELAELLGVSARRIQQLADAGMPREDRGQYDVGTCVRWFLAYRERLVRDKAKSTALQDVQFRKEAALASLRELELAKQLGQLVDLDFMADQVDRILAAVAGEIRNLPTFILRALADSKLLRPRMERRARRLLEDQVELLLGTLQSAGDNLDDLQVEDTLTEKPAET